MEDLYLITMGLILAILIPQSIKTITTIIKTRKLTLSSLFVNGGMPSSHSSFVAALSTAILITQKFSMLSIVVLAFSLIIIRDSFGIRLEVEKQKKIFRKMYPGDSLVDQLKREGHTILQVVTGILFGMVLMALILLLF